MIEMVDLTNEELFRYEPHLLLTSVGEEGQKKLKNAKVLCVGGGGIGSPLLLYLAAAGIGTLGVIDNDFVSLSNLQRQILYSEDEVGKSKARSAAKRLSALNSQIHVVAHDCRLTAENAEEVLSQYDLVADGSDNFSTRYLVNHFCLKLNKALVSASVSDFQGQCSVFVPSEGPCYQCLFPKTGAEEPLPTCGDRGILGVLPGILGTIQAAEVVKRILGIGTSLEGKLLTVDVLSWTFKTYRFEKNPDCPACGSGKKESPGLFPEMSCKTKVGASGNEISPRELARLIDRKEVSLLDVRELCERAQYHIGGLHIPLSQLSERRNELSFDRPVVVYCQSGVRSLKAGEILKGLGFEDVVSLRGGIRAWVDSKVSP